MARQQAIAVLVFVLVSCTPATTPVLMTIPIHIHVHIQTLLDVWGGDPQQGIYSKSVQQTAYRIATAILDNFPCIDVVTLTTPNIHHYRHELEQFGLENPNIVFQVRRTTPVVNPA